LINEILEGKPLEEDIISQINNSNEPYSTELALKLLYELKEKWEREEEKTSIIFKTDEENMLEIINQTIQYKKTKLGG
jgi:hypothetical protein